MGPRRQVTFPLFGEGIFTQEGEAWKHSRDLLRPHLMHKKYSDLKIFKLPVENLIEAVRKDNRDGIIDLQPLFLSLTLDIITAFLFGESVNSLKASQSVGGDAFADALNVAQDYMAKRYRFPSLRWIISGKKFRRACHTVHQFASNIIKQKLSEVSQSDRPLDRQSFLALLAEEISDRDALRGQIINILVAGRDTTACLLSWTFFNLVRYPSVMDKLRAEIATAMNKNQALTREDLNKMKYLQQVLKETLRLYPSVPLNTRTAVRTTILPTGGGPDRTSPVLVPRGSAITFSSYVMHRDKELFHAPKEFIPERWDSRLPMQNDSVSAKWGYLPFSGGQRMCPGMDFALTEAAYTIVQLLQTFSKIELPRGEVVQPTGDEKKTVTLVLSSTYGCKVKIGK